MHPAQRLRLFRYGSRKNGLEDFMRASGMDSTRDIRTSRGDRLAWVSEWVEFNAPLDTIHVISEAETVLHAYSTVAPRRERDDRCLSTRLSASFAPIGPNSERSHFSSVSGLSDLAVGTICESQRTGSRGANTTWLHDRLRLIVARRCWFRSGTDRNTPSYATNEHTTLRTKWEKWNMKRCKFTLFNTNETSTIFC